jgi:5'-3' exonuclease
MRYLLIDTSNMFFRARHQAHRAADTWTKLGFALHLTLMSANKVARDLGADHVVFALEGRSWRKDHYKPYKANRAVARGQMSESEAEEDKLFWETYDELTKYLSTRTNCSVFVVPQQKQMTSLHVGLLYTPKTNTLLSAQILTLCS